MVSEYWGKYSLNDGIEFKRVNAELMLKLNRMNESGLLAYAKKNGIWLERKGTKKEIIDCILLGQVEG